MDRRGAAGERAPAASPRRRALQWREDASERTLRRDGRRWTAWTAWVVVVFVAAGRGAARDRAARPSRSRADLLRARLGRCPRIQARRGARRWCRSAASAAPARRPGREPGAERVALGLLGDLVGHAERELLREHGPGARARRARASGCSASRGRSWSARGGRRVDLLVRAGRRDRRSCRPATASPTCCWRCARTSSASPRSRTWSSPARPGGSGGSCRSGRGEL